MKHEITNYNTKKALVEALKEAMKSKPFSKVTVSEIISICGVNRKTFYYHFEDIYALLKWMFQQEAIEVMKHFDLFSDYESAIRFVLDYVEQNEHLIYCAYDSIGRDELKKFFYDDFMDVIVSVISTAEEESSVQLDAEFKVFLAKFYAEALAGMLIDCIKTKDRIDKEKVVKYLTTIIKCNLESLESLKKCSQF